LSKVSPENLLPLGKVIRPHGLQGILRIWSYSRSEKSFSDAGAVYLQSCIGEIEKYTVLSVKPHKNIFLMKLKELTSLEKAEGYRGAAILIREDHLRHENEDEYFWHELIGLSVYLDSGRYIGTIAHILPTGSNDIYLVREGKKEVLIPAIYDVVKEIDLANKRMIICELEGLLDWNEV
jgi:16S rRNA processing protein RimM